MSLLHNNLNENLPKNGMGTREALFVINTLMQRCLDVNRNIFACFIDFNKIFDNVQHDKLIKILIVEI
jgi:hypothetical protein